MRYSLVVVCDGNARQRELRPFEDDLRAIVVVVVASDAVAYSHQRTVQLRDCLLYTSDAADE